VQPTIHALNLEPFQSATRRLALVTGKTQQGVLRTAAKMTLSNPRQGSGLLQITPPCSKGRSGLDGKRQGEAAIERDLAKVFVPIASRGIGARGQSPTPIHRLLFHFKKPGKPLRLDRPWPYYVDQTKLRALERELKKRVGFLASGWVASARQLGASVPAWVARHGPGRGTVRMTFSAPRYSIEMTCFAPWNSPYQELERRIPYAIQYATNNLERQIKHLLERDVNGVGLSAIF
jgi:hypothetical protein